VVEERPERRERTLVARHLRGRARRVAHGGLVVAERVRELVRPRLVVADTREREERGRPDARVAARDRVEERAHALLVADETQGRRRLALEVDPPLRERA